MTDWAEYRESHRDELREASRWGREVLADRDEAAVLGSGMSSEGLDQIRLAFSEPDDDGKSADRGQGSP